MKRYSSQVADFFSMDFISSSSTSAQNRNEVNPFLLKANETFYVNTTEDQVELLINSIGYPAWDMGQVLGIYEEYGVESVYVPAFASDKETIKSLIRFSFAKDETVSVRVYNTNLYTLIYSQYPNSSQATNIDNLINFFINRQQLVAQERDCGNYNNNCQWVGIGVDEMVQCV